MQWSEAAKEWNLERLNADLGEVKRAYTNSNKSTPSLNEFEEACLRGLLCGYGPTEIAIALNRDRTGLRVDLSRGLYAYIEVLTDQRPKNWRQIPMLLERAGYRFSVATVRQPHRQSSILQNLGEVVDVSRFCGRTEELKTIREWIIERAGRVVTLVGMGGVGKTALAAKFVQEGITDDSDLAKAGFKGVIWRSLRYAPSPPEMVQELSQFVASTNELPIAGNIDQQISYLLTHLRNQRYLIVLDDWECLLQGSELAGYCSKEHEGYGRLLQRLAGEQHQSCLLLISREQPVEITPLASEVSPVHLFKLKGLQLVDAKGLLGTRGFSPNEPGLTELIQIHRGNPAALKLAATTVQEIFDGSISQFLAQTSLVLGDVLLQMLEQQFDRLSEVEKTVMFCLGVAGRAAPLTDLKRSVEAGSQSELLVALESLRRRSLLDKISGSISGEVLFALEPVVMKYVIQQLIFQVCRDLSNVIQTKSLPQLGLLRSHRLVREQEDEVKQSQSWRMLQRIQDRLRAGLKGDVEQVRAELEEILVWLREQNPQSIGYAEINVTAVLQTIKPSTFE